MLQRAQRRGTVRDPFPTDPAAVEEPQQRVAKRGLVVHDEHGELAGGRSGVRRCLRLRPRFLARVARQRDAEPRPVPGLRLHPDAAAVVAGDPVADGEPEAGAHTLGFGGEERVEDLAADLGRDTGAGVGDLEPGLAIVGARANDDRTRSVDGHQRLLRVDQQVEDHLLQVGRVGPDLGLARVEVERDRDVQRREVIGAQGERAARDVVHVHEGALFAAGARERQQIGGDPADARRLVVHHLQHFTVLGLQVVQQQGLRESGDDRRRVVDFVGHAAHELPHGGELFGLLELGLVPLLLGNVARQDQYPGNPASLADRGVQDGADPGGLVVACEGNLEPLNLPAERSGQFLPDHGRRVGRQELEDVAVFRRPDQRPHDVGGPIRFDDPPPAVDDHDRIGHGVHEEPQIPLRGGGRRERVHERPGLAGDLVLEQRRVAPVGAGGMNQTQPDDHDGQRDEHRAAHVGLVGQRVSDRDRADAAEPDHEGRDARGVARDSARPGLRAQLSGRGHGRRRGEQQQAGVPPEIERTARVKAPPQGGRGVHHIRDAQDAQRRHDARRGQGNPRVGQQLHEDQPEHRDAADGPGDAREHRRDAAGQVEQRLEEELVDEHARHERHEHGVDQQLGVESAARLGSDQLRHGDQETDVHAQVAHVSQRRVRRRHATDQLVVVPDELAPQEQHAACTDPQPCASLIR